MSEPKYDPPLPIGELGNCGRNGMSWDGLVGCDEESRTGEDEICSGLDLAGGKLRPNRARALGAVDVDAFNDIPLVSGRGLVPGRLPSGVRGPDSASICCCCC